LFHYVNVGWLHLAAYAAAFATKTRRTGEYDILVGQGYGDREKIAYLSSYVAQRIAQPKAGCNQHARPKNMSLKDTLAPKASVFCKISLRAGIPEIG
jgi:hypothetical protein